MKIGRFEVGAPQSPEEEMEVDAYEPRSPAPSSAESGPASSPPAFAPTSVPPDVLARHFSDWDLSQSCRKEEPDSETPHTRHLRLYFGDWTDEQRAEWITMDHHLDNQTRESFDFYKWNRAALTDAARRSHRKDLKTMGLPFRRDGTRKAPKVAVRSGVSPETNRVQAPPPPSNVSSPSTCSQESSDCGMDTSDPSNSSMLPDGDE